MSKYLLLLGTDDDGDDSNLPITTTDLDRTPPNSSSSVNSAVKSKNCPPLTEISTAVNIPPFLPTSQFDLPPPKPTTDPLPVQAPLANDIVSSLCIPLPALPDPINKTPLHTKFPLLELKPPNLSNVATIFTIQFVVSILPQIPTGLSLEPASIFSNSASPSNALEGMLGVDVSDTGWNLGNYVGTDLTNIIPVNIRNTECVKFRGLDMKLLVFNFLMKIYLKCEWLDCERKVLDKMPVQELISWTLLIHAYANMGELDSTSKFICKLTMKNLMVNSTANEVKSVVTNGDSRGESDINNRREQVKTRSGFSSFEKNQDSSNLISEGIKTDFNEGFRQYKLNCICCQDDKGVIEKGPDHALVKFVEYMQLLLGFPKLLLLMKCCEKSPLFWSFGSCLNEECHEFLFLVTTVLEDRVITLYESRGMNVLASQMPTLPDGSHVMELAMTLVQLIISKLATGNFYANHTSKLSNMVSTIAKQFDTYRNLAKAHIQAMQFDEAQKFCQVAPEIHKENGLPTSLQEAANRQLMGMIYESNGDHETIFKHLVLARMAMVAKEHELEETSVLCSLGDMNLSLNRFDKALKLMQKGLEIHNDALGKQNTIAGIDAQMGVMHYMAGQYSNVYSFGSAITKLREGIEKKLAFLGIALNQMGQACVKRHAINEAVRMFEEARSLWEQEYEPYHPKIILIFDPGGGCTFDVLPPSLSLHLKMVLEFHCQIHSTLRTR